MHRRIVLIAGMAGILAGLILVRPTGARNDDLPGAGIMATIALSASVDSSGELSARGTARLEEAIRLARLTRSRWLVTTRIQVDGRSSDSGQARLIRAAGLEPIWLPLAPVVGSTREEAQAFRDAQLGAGRIVVVTSPSHAWRACATFEKLGFQVTCRASPDRSTTLDHIYERTARMKYCLAGWIEDCLGP